LHVSWPNDSKVVIEPSNVLSFVVPRLKGPFHLFVEESTLSFPSVDDAREIRRVEDDPGKWEVRTVIHPIFPI